MCEKKYTENTRQERIDGSYIRIRWSCGRLGHHSRESRFCIKPNADFKMMYGCGYPAEPASGHSSTTVRQQSRPSGVIRAGTGSSNEVVDRSHREMEDDTLVRPNRTTSLVDVEGSTRTKEELDAAELVNVFDSYSQAKRALELTETDPQSYGLSTVTMHKSSRNATSSSGIPRTTVPIPSSSGDSLLDFNEHFTTLSTDTPLSDYSHSETRCSYSLSNTLENGHRLAQSHSIYSPYSISGWMGQPTSDEPWTARSAGTVIQERAPEPRIESLRIRRCTELDDERQQILDRARAVAEKEAASYWIWDEEVQQYKHYDEGCTDPVWYNPP